MQKLQDFWEEFLIWFGLFVVEPILIVGEISGELFRKVFRREEKE